MSLRDAKTRALMEEVRRRVGADRGVWVTVGPVHTILIGRTAIPGHYCEPEDFDAPQEQSLEERARAFKSFRVPSDDAVDLLLDITKQVDANTRRLDEQKSGHIPDWTGKTTEELRRERNDLFVRLDALLEAAQYCTALFAEGVAIFAGSHASEALQAAVKTEEAHRE